MTYFWHIIALIGIQLPSVLGYNVVFGRGKIFHFGPVGVSAITAYATFITLGATQNYVIAVIAGFTAAMLSSLIFAWATLRLDPDALGILTIAMHLAVVTVILNWTDLTRGALGIPGIPRMPLLESVPAFAIASACIAAVWTLILYRILRGSYGRALGALAEHDWHARSIGINRTRTMIIAFLLSGMGAACSNMLYPQYLHLLHPSDYQFPAFIFMIMCVVAGKPGSIPGVTIATILLMILKELLRFLPLSPDLIGPLRLMLFGIILLAAVALRRNKLFPAQRTV